MTWPQADWPRSGRPSLTCAGPCASSGTARRTRPPARPGTWSRTSPAGLGPDPGGHRRRQRITRPSVARRPPTPVSRRTATLRHVQDEAGGGAEGGQGLRPDVLLLVQLLAVTAAGEVGVRGAARAVGAVPGAAVPEVAIEHDDGTRRSGDQDLVGVAGGRVGQG